MLNIEKPEAIIPSGFSVFFLWH